MASTSFNEFRYNMHDAKRLYQAHGVLSLKTPGKKGLGHITRSGVVMLCAAWERYHESVLVEGVSYLSREIHEPKKLPLSVQKYLSAIVKQSMHELKPMELAGNGWRALYVAQAIYETDSLNTPKSEKLKTLYERLAGVPDVSTFWTIGAQLIDDFVSTRGDIAHNGRKSQYITASTLNYYINMIQGAAAEHDRKFCDYLKAASGANVQPWRKTA
jgi:hypothetical protein